MRPERSSLTAELTCLLRVVESRRPSGVRVLNDHYASWLLPERVGTLLPTPRSPKISPLSRFDATVPVRHRHFDLVLESALHGTVRQVLTLGAGFESRAFRYEHALAGRPYFEVDHPATLERKSRRIGRHADRFAAGSRRPVRVDFERDRLDEQLIAAGFEVGAPTVVIWEGVTMYLEEAAVRQTLETLGHLVGPGSRLALDFWSPRPLSLSNPRSWMTRLGETSLSWVSEPLRFACPPARCEQLLGELGWEIHELLDAEALERRYLSDGRRFLDVLYLVEARR